MKLETTELEFDQLPESNKLFLVLWKQKKGYEQTTVWSFAQLVELALALTNDLHFESPAERTTFNNALHYDEIHVAWDGREPIDVLWYELNKKLKRRITQYIVVTSK